MVSESAPLDVGGYVLAGGQSSRMGRDKALLVLGGKPLVQHAVETVGRVCREVAILSARPELAGFGRLVPDRHPGCGPLGGMEAALYDTRFDWNLFLPVDVPFLPSTFLREWLVWFRQTNEGTETMPGVVAGAVRGMFWTVDGRAQPTVALLHRDMAPWLTAALDRGEFRLGFVLENAARLAATAAGLPPESGLLKPAFPPDFWSSPKPSRTAAASDSTAWRGQAEARWFSNLNTPEEFAEAERHRDRLDR